MSRASLTTSQYACVVADPPWRYKIPGGRAAATNHYETADTETICAVQPPVADSAHLYLWVTNNHLLDGDGVTVVRAWGFEPKQLLTWVKSGNIGLGHYFRNTTEHVIFATRGKAPVLKRNFPTHFTGARAEVPCHLPPDHDGPHQATRPSEEVEW